MKVYMAALYTNDYMPNQRRHPRLMDYEQKAICEVPNLLESFHYIDKQAKIDTIRANGDKVFLDSGAFSAWSKGATINIDEYIEYVKNNMDLWLVEGDALMCSVLDGIGDVNQTWINQDYMEKRGVRPLPCFHYGEPIEALEYYVKNYSYITIGGMVGKSTKALMSWLDVIFDKVILNSYGECRTKVHAFGITSQDIMKRYPWFSCDSSSWVQAAAFGNIITAEWGILCISDQSARKHQYNAHINTLPAPERERVSEYVKSHGFDLERLSSVYESRAVFNLKTFNEINEWINTHEPTLNDGIRLELF